MRSLTLFLILVPLLWVPSIPSQGTLEVYGGSNLVLLQPGNTENVTDVIRVKTDLQDLGVEFTTSSPYLEVVHQTEMVANLFHIDIEVNADIQAPSGQYKLQYSVGSQEGRVGGTIPVVVYSESEVDGQVVSIAGQDPLLNTRETELSLQYLVGKDWYPLNTQVNSLHEFFLIYGDYRLTLRDTRAEVQVRDEFTLHPSNSSHELLYQLPLLQFELVDNTRSLVKLTVENKWAPFQAKMEFTDGEEIVTSWDLLLKVGSWDVTFPIAGEGHSSLRWQVIIDGVVVYERLLEFEDESDVTIWLLPAGILLALGSGVGVVVLKQKGRIKQWLT